MLENLELAARVEGAEAKTWLSIGAALLLVGMFLLRGFLTYLKTPKTDGVQTGFGVASLLLSALALTGGFIEVQSNLPVAFDPEAAVAVRQIKAQEVQQRDNAEALAKAEAVEAMAEIDPAELLAALDAYRSAKEE